LNCSNSTFSAVVSPNGLLSKDCNCCANLLVSVVCWANLVLSLIVSLMANESPIKLSESVVLIFELISY